MNRKKILCGFLFFIMASLVVPPLLLEGKAQQKGKKGPHRVLAPFKKIYKLIPGSSFLVLRKWSQPNLIWYWPHNDEYAARETVYWAYRHFGGFAFLFSNTGNNYQRNLSFILPGNGRFFLDPNRMFQKEGLSSNLKLLNIAPILQKTPNKALAYSWNKIGKKAHQILLRYWSKKRPLIALHNNRYLNITKYRDNTKSFRVAEFKNNPTSTFVFVLTAKHFKQLKACGINTVYQKVSQKDGSLSDFAIERNLPYINIETRVYYPEEQRKITQKTVYALFPKLFHKQISSRHLC